MECKNRKIQEKLTDYFSGHLPAKEKSEVESHLESCEVCRKHLETMKLLGGEGPGRGIFDARGHIEPDILGTYYSDKESLAPDIRARIEEHVNSCDECAYDLGLVSDMDEELTRSVRGLETEPGFVARVLSALVPIIRKPAFAYFLLLLTLFPTIQWLRHAGVETQPSLETFRLAQITRSGGEIPEVVRPAGQELLRLDLPAAHAEADYAYDIAVLNETTGREMMPQRIITFPDPQTVQVVLDAESLSDGDYTLYLYEIDRADPSDSMEFTYPFRLVTR